MYNLIFMYQMWNIKWIHTIFCSLIEHLALKYFRHWKRKKTGHATWYIYIFLPWNNRGFFYDILIFIQSLCTRKIHLHLMVSYKGTCNLMILLPSSIYTKLVLKKELQSDGLSRTESVSHGPNTGPFIYWKEGPGNLSTVNHLRISSESWSGRQQ